MLDCLSAAKLLAFTVFTSKESPRFLGGCYLKAKDR